MNADMKQDFVLAELCPRLLPGFRFKPSDEELLNHYLRRKVHGPGLSQCEQALVLEKEHFYDLGAPWNIFSREYGIKDAHYCFVKLKRSTKEGKTVKRKMKSGSWTGQSNTEVIDMCGTFIGVKKLLSFKVAGLSEHWNMYEYSLPGWKHGDWVLCKILYSQKQAAAAERYTGIKRKQEDTDRFLQHDNNNDDIPSSSSPASSSSISSKRCIGFITDIMPQILPPKKTLAGAVAALPQYLPVTCNYNNRHNNPDIWTSEEYRRDLKGKEIERDVFSSDRLMVGINFMNQKNNNIIGKIAPYKNKVTFSPQPAGMIVPTKNKVMIPPQSAGLNKNHNIISDDQYVPKCYGLSEAYGDHSLGTVKLDRVSFCDDELDSYFDNNISLD